MKTLSAGMIALQRLMGPTIMATLYSHIFSNQGHAMNSDAARSVTSYDFDCLVFIGRFQPPHLGHLAIIREALKQARQVIVMVGLVVSCSTVVSNVAVASRLVTETSTSI